MRRYRPKGLKATYQFARRAGLTALIGIFLFLFASFDAAASPPVVYFSPADDGINPGGPSEIPGSELATLYLYLDSGPTASVSDPCHIGIGDEVCGWDIQVEASAGLSLIGFVGDGDVVSHISGSILRFNGGEVGSGTLGPVRLGELTVNGTPDSSVELLTSKSISSSLNTEIIAPATLVTVPEPGLLSALIVGCAAMLMAWPRHAA